MEHVKKLDGLGNRSIGTSVSTPVTGVEAITSDTVTDVTGIGIEQLLTHSEFAELYAQVSRLRDIEPQALVELVVVVGHVIPKEEIVSWVLSH